MTVVPKGLRSFDSGDAQFFLELLPGPRDEDGLPESLRFWKHRIESSDELFFTIGVIYGPSGCGKSSLVKAGLLPRLCRRSFRSMSNPPRKRPSPTCSPGSEGGRAAWRETSISRKPPDKRRARSRDWPRVNAY